MSSAPAPVVGKASRTGTARLSLVPSTGLWAANASCFLGRRALGVREQDRLLSAPPCNGSHGSIQNLSPGCPHFRRPVGMRPTARRTFAERPLRNANGFAFAPSRRDKEGRRCLRKTRGTRSCSRSTTTTPTAILATTSSARTSVQGPAESRFAKSAKGCVSRVGNP